MEEDQYLKLAAYVNCSNYRTKVMNHLRNNPNTIPTQIAKSVSIRSNHISIILRELKNSNLVECINPEMRKGKLYRLTSRGEKVAEYMNEIR